MAYFYWSAEEAFAKRQEECGHLHTEVVDGLCRLDVNSYAADALQPFLLSLLNVACIDGALRLAETFLTVVRKDRDLMRWVVPEYCRELFELRIGRAIRNHRSGSDLSAEKLAAKLLCDIEEEIHADLALAVAGVVAAPDSETNDDFEWSRPVFALVTGNTIGNDPSWAAGVNLFATLVRVARENWHIDAQAPEKTVVALSLLLKSAYPFKQETGKKKQSACGNLLDCLRPSGMENRIASSCVGMMGTDMEKARLLLDAHDTLKRTALRHGVISSDEAIEAERQIQLLRAKIF